MTKPKIPSPQNIKKREAYIFKHAHELSEVKVQDELTKIYTKRAAKKLKWEKPVVDIDSDTSTNSEIRIVMRKPTLIERIKSIFKRGVHVFRVK